MHIHGHAVAEVAMQLVGGLVQHGQGDGTVVVAGVERALLEGAGASAGGERLEALLLA